MKLAILSVLSVGLIFGQTHSATLTWGDTLNPLGTTYNALRTTGTCSGNPIFTKINLAAIPDKTYLDTAVQPGSYAYVVTAVYNGSESAYSNCALAAVPAYAPNLQSSTVDPATRKVTLLWTAPSDVLSGTTYSAFRAPGNCSGSPTFTKISATPIAALTYPDLNVPIGPQCYAVTALTNSVESARSNTMAATIPTFAVANLTITVQ